MDGALICGQALSLGSAHRGGPSFYTTVRAVEPFARYLGVEYVS